MFKNPQHKHMVPEWSYFENPKLHLSKLLYWDPQFFTDPKKYAEKVQNAHPPFNSVITLPTARQTTLAFQFIVHTAPITDLIYRKGVFSKNGILTIEERDTLCTSLITERNTSCFYKIGVILKVPKQNILMTSPVDIWSTTSKKKQHVNIRAPKIRGDWFGEAPYVDPRDRTGGQIITKAQQDEMPPHERNGLLSKEISMSYSQLMFTPNELLERTIHNHSEIIVATRPGVNIHPGLPATQKLEITGFFMKTAFKIDEREWDLGRKAGNDFGRSYIIENYLLPIAKQIGVPTLLIPDYSSWKNFMPLH